MFRTRKSLSEEERSDWISWVTSSAALAIVASEKAQTACVEWHVADSDIVCVTYIEAKILLIGKQIYSNFLVSGTFFVAQTSWWYHSIQYFFMWWQIKPHFWLWDYNNACIKRHYKIRERCVPPRERLEVEIHFWTFYEWKNLSYAFFLIVIDLYK